MAELFHAERLALPSPVHPRLAALARKLASASPFDLCVVTGVREAAGVAEKWAQGRTAPGPHAGEPGYPPLGLTVTRVSTLEHAPHALRVTPDGVFGTAMDLQFQVKGRLLEGRLLVEQAAYTALGEMAELDGFTWGGRFAAKDLAHYELRNWRTFPLAQEINNG
jgi:hypothetical protein